MTRISGSSSRAFPRTERGYLWMPGIVEANGFADMVKMVLPELGSRSQRKIGV